MSITFAAGPEFRIGLELIALVNAFGLELFLLSITASMWSHWYFIRSKLEKLDPYFFFSPPKDILKCPALIAHAVPGSMGLLVVVLGITTVSI
jgi:hypothetical protein